MIRTRLKSWHQRVQSLVAGQASRLVFVSIILLTFLLGFTIGKLGAKYAILLAGVLLSIVFLVLMLEKGPLIVLVVLILASFSVDYLLYIFMLPFSSSYILLLMIGLLFFLVLLSPNNKEELWSSLRPLIGLLLALFLIIVVSAFFNSVASSVIIASLKNYFTYPLLFLVLVMMDLPGEQQKFIRLLLLGLILIQVPIAVLQHYSFLPGAAATISGIEDRAGGTVGVNATGILSLLCIGVAGIMLTLIVFDGVKMRYLVAALLAILGPIMAEGKIAIFLLPVVVLTVIGLKARFGSVGKWYRLTFIILLGVGLVFSTIYLIQTLAINTNLVSLLSSPSNLLLYMTTIGGDPLLAKFGRLTDLRVTVELLGQNIRSLLFGFGPGLMSRSGQVYAASSPFSIYLIKGIGGFEATAILLETGALGAIAYLVLPVLIVVKVLKTSREIQDSSLVLQITSFVVVTVVFWVGAFYSQPWWSPALSVSFWTFAGLTWSNMRKAGLKHEQGSS
jgi:hypothetical protein